MVYVTIFTIIIQFFVLFTNIIKIYMGIPFVYEPTIISAYETWYYRIMLLFSYRVLNTSFRIMYNIILKKKLNIRISNYEYLKIIIKSFIIIILDMPRIMLYFVESIYYGIKNKSNPFYELM
jgi:hypothetical protein